MNERLQIAARTALIFLLLPGFVPRVAAQVDTKEVDLTAESFTSDVSGGERVNRLFGNVRLRQGETTLWSNRAVQYTERDEILFSERVRIGERGDTLTANSVRYYRRTKTGRARGRVILSDGDVVVKAPAAFHNVERKYTRFENGVELVDSLSTLTARQGEYWSDEKRALFVGEIRLLEDGSVTRADTVNFQRDESIADAFGNVSVIRTDKESGDSSFVWLFGERAHNESRRDYSTVEGNALLVQVRPDSSGSDTTALTADRLVSREEGTLEFLSGSGNVSIFKEKLAATADSVAFRKRSTPGGETTETVWLYRSPILWYETTQVVGDSIRMTLINGELDSLFVDGNAFLAQEDTLIGRIHEVGGPTIRGSLRSGKREITIGEGADAVYYLSEDAEPSGATRTHSRSVVMKFDGDTLSTIVALGDIEGTYYTEELIPSDLGLAGMTWKPEQRPTREIYATDPRFRAMASARND